jgi:hypothetical protein
VLGAVAVSLPLETGSQGGVEPPQFFQPRSPSFFRGNHSTARDVLPFIVTPLGKESGCAGPHSPCP